MKRREFMAMVGGVVLAFPRAVFPQTPGRTYHLGTLHPVAPMSEVSPYGKIMLGVLAQHGYILGKNLTYDARSSMGDNAKIPGLLQDMKASGVDAILVVGFPGALAAKSIGVPIVGA